MLNLTKNARILTKFNSNIQWK